LLTEHTKKALKKAAEVICNKNNLPHVYFSQKFGKRRHFITGCGEETFTKTRHREITEMITLSWEGTMTDKKAQQAIEPFAKLLDRVQEELNQS